MGPRPRHLQLRRLLDESLRPYSDIATNSFNLELEKELLIALSQVLIRIRQWTCHLDSDEELRVDGTESCVLSNSHLDNFHCLNNFIGDLIALLVVESRYVQHLVGNILVAISEFFLASANGSDDFTQLCRCFELAICQSLVSLSAPVAFEIDGSKHEPSSSRSSRSVAAIFRVLHHIQKYIKQDSNDILVKAYLASMASLLSNLPWDILRETYFDNNIDTLRGSSKDASIQVEALKSEEITSFCGSFIQFLCSLVSQFKSLDDGVRVREVNLKIINLVPVLTTWCEMKVESSLCARISHYFRHKVLMLMVKLISNTRIEQIVLVKWADLVRNHFQDLLLQPISRGESCRVDFLESSPFFYQNSPNYGCRHLQRLTVFLFLKCSLSSVGMKTHPEEPEQTYDYPGFEKLYEWIQTQVPADILVNDELYFDRCVRFTSSFLELFMHEDDILFEILLLLFRVPFYPQRRAIIQDEPLADGKSRSILLASDLFNPVYIFHVFLAQIHYDHRVFLDYLISKDSGSSCAEYLLRSIRVVCSSWRLFVEFPGLEEDIPRLARKRQKVSINSTGSEERNQSHGHGRNNCRMNTLAFEAARDCLVSLKKTINRLNRKSLFPYNPQALLKRLVRFEELRFKP